MAGGSDEVCIRRRRPRRAGSTGCAGRRSASGRRAAEGRSVHDRRLLPGCEALVGSALFPVQQSFDLAGNVGRRHRRLAEADRLSSARECVVGPLRRRLSARGDRFTVSVQDRARTLRSVARGDEGETRADHLHARETAARLERALQSRHLARVHGEASGQDLRDARACRGTAAVVLYLDQPDLDDPLAADAGVSTTHGSDALPPGGHERAAVAGAVLLARRVHASVCAAGAPLDGFRHDAGAAAADGEQRG